MSRKKKIVDGIHCLEDDFIRLVIETLGEARMVGGCVRDTIVQRPIKDVDIATSLKPETVTKKLEKAGVKVIPTGIKHGTVTAVLDKKSVEITTLRRDVEAYGRHAKVEFTDSWEEDAARRDFTVNAMSMGLDGKIYDYFGGQKDLSKGIIRFVGDPEQRVQEDYLRILRYFRFEAHYGSHSIDKQSLAACVKYKDKISTLSGERIQNEMLKLLTAKDPHFVLTLMREEKILDEVLYAKSSNADLGAIRHLVTIEKEEGSVVPSKDAIIRLALLITNGSNQAKEICDKWKCSNSDRKQLMDLVNPEHQITSAIEESEQKKALITLGKEDFVRQLVYLWARDDENEHIGACKRMLALANTWQIPEFPVQGKDLIKLGFPEGKRVGELLNKARDFWIFSDYKASKRAILDFIKKQKL